MASVGPLARGLNSNSSSLTDDRGRGPERAARAKSLSDPPDTVLASAADPAVAGVDGGYGKGPMPDAADKATTAKLSTSPVTAGSAAGSPRPGRDADVGEEEEEEGEEGEEPEDVEADGGKDRVAGDAAGSAGPAAAAAAAAGKAASTVGIPRSAPLPARSAGATAGTSGNALSVPIPSSRARQRATRRTQPPLPAPPPASPSARPSRKAQRLARRAGGEDPPPVGPMPAATSGRAADEAAAARGRRREGRLAAAAAAEAADAGEDDCLSSDEEEAMWEDVDRYLRARTPAEDEALARATEGLQPVGKARRLTREQQAGIVALNAIPGYVVKESVARRPVVPFSVVEHQRRVQLRLPNRETQHDILVITGRNMGGAGGGAGAVGKLAGSARMPSGARVDFPRSDAAAAAATAAEGSSSRGAAGVGGGSSGAAVGQRRRRPSAADESAAAAAAAAPGMGGPSPSKRARASGGGGGGGGDSRMFTKHAEKKGWVVCRKCRTAVWPPNCTKHLQHCAKIGG